MANVCFSVSLGCAGSQPGYNVMAVKLFAILFDQETYPGEHDNLAAKYPEKVSELNSLMEMWMKQSCTKVLTPNPALRREQAAFNTLDEALKKAREEKKAQK